MAHTVNPITTSSTTTPAAKPVGSQKGRKFGGQSQALPSTPLSRRQDQLVYYLCTLTRWKDENDAKRRARRGQAKFFLFLFLLFLLNVTSSPVSLQNYGSVLWDGCTHQLVFVGVYKVLVMDAVPVKPLAVLWLCFG